VYNSDCEERLGLSVATAQMHAQILLDNWPEVHTKILHLINNINDSYDGKEEASEVDFRLYSGGFFSYDERKIFDQIITLSPQELINFKPNFSDARSSTLFKRYVARNFFDKLDSKKAEEWRLYCANRLTFPPSTATLSFSDFRTKIGELSQNIEDNTKMALLNELFSYGRRLEQTLLKSIKVMV
jgi:exodeoxyribonuclease-1